MLGEADQAMADAASGFSVPAAAQRQLYRDQWRRDAQRRSGARISAPEPPAEQLASAASFMKPCACSCGELVDTRVTGPCGRPKQYASQACRARAYRARQSAAKAGR